MLSDLIQLNIIKSQTHFNRPTPLQFNHNKYSLQLESNNYFQKQNKILKNYHQQSQYTEIYNCSKLSKNKHARTKPNDSAKNSYPSEDQYCFQIPNNKIHHEKQQKKRLRLIQTSQFMIKSPKRQNGINTIRINSKQKNPLIVSSKSKFLLLQKSQQKKPLINSKLYGSKMKVSNDYKSKQNKMDLQNIFSLNKNQTSTNKRNYSQKKYLFRSLTHNNLSPLKSKLCVLSSKNEINKSTKLINKHNLNSSNSFRSAILKSKQERLRNNPDKIGDKQQKHDQLQIINKVNKQYYSNQNKQKNRLIYNNQIPFSNNGMQKIIKNSISNNNTIQAINRQSQRYNINYQYLDDIVNNSNLINSSIKLDSKILNMDPY